MEDENTILKNVIESLTNETGYQTYCKDWKNSIAFRKLNLVENEEIKNCKKIIFSLLYEDTSSTEIDKNIIICLFKTLYKRDFYDISNNILAWYCSTHKKVIINFLLNELFGGRVGYIHGGASYSICLISTVLLSLCILNKNTSLIKCYDIEERGRDIGLVLKNIKSYRVSYLNKLDVYSNIIVISSYSEKDNMIISEIRNFNDKICVVVKFKLKSLLINLTNSTKF